MRYNRGIFLSIAAIAAFLSLAARATAQDHSGHKGHDMAAMMSVGEDGSWFYAGRDYPKMLLHGRWETIPVAGRAGAADSEEGMTLQARCGALMASQNLMHDRATQGQPAEAQASRVWRRNASRCTKIMTWVMTAADTNTNLQADGEKR